MRAALLASLSAVLLATGFAPAAHAQFPAFTQTQTYSNSGWGVNTTRGWSFTVSVPVVVQQLGFWDSTPPDGLSVAHPIGIWSSSGTLLTSATVPAGTAAPLDGRFRWVATAPVTLSPGATYVIGTYWPQATDENLEGGTSVAFDSRVSLIEGRAINTTGLAYPPLTAAAELSANFKMSVAPEVTVLPPYARPLLGALLLGASLLALRRKKV